MKNNNELIKHISICIVPSETDMMRFKVTDGSDKDKIGIYTAAFPASYKVYLVNESQYAVVRVEMKSDGFDGSGEDLVTLNALSRSFGAVPTDQALFLEELDYGLLDFVINYHLDLYLEDGDRVPVEATLFKAPGLKAETLSFVESLGATAYHLEIREVEIIKNN